jgi:hypothetical protein
VNRKPRIVFDNQLHIRFESQVTRADEHYSHVFVNDAYLGLIVVYEKEHPSVGWTMTFISEHPSAKHRNRYVRGYQKSANEAMNHAQQSIVSMLHRHGFQDWNGVHEGQEN